MEEYIEINELMEKLYTFVCHFLPHLDDYISTVDDLSRIAIARVGEFFLENDIEPFMNEDFIPMDIMNKIELLKRFYQEKNIPLDLDLILSNGVIDLECRKLEDYSFQGAFKEGCNSYLEDKKSIEIYDHGILLDTVAWLHEFAHYRNQTDKDRSEMGKLFTETISFISELFYLDYLVDQGYEVEDYYLDNLNGEAGMIKLVAPILHLLHVYSKTGEITKENFNSVYPDSSTVKSEFSEYSHPSDFSFHISYVLDDYHDSCCDHDYYWSIVVGIMYSLAFPLQVYLYEEYKKDPTIFNQVEKLNDSLPMTNFEECMKLIGIDIPLTEEFLEKMDYYLSNYLNRSGSSYKKMLFKRGIDYV